MLPSAWADAPGSTKPWAIVVMIFMAFLGMYAGQYFAQTSKGEANEHPPAAEPPTTAAQLPNPAQLAVG